MYPNTITEKLASKLIKAITLSENTLIKLIACCLFYRRYRGNVERVMIFLSGGIGDFIATIPAIKRIREMFPHARILLLCTDSSIKKVSMRHPENPEWFDFVDHLIDERIFIKGYDILKKESINRARNAVKRLSPQIIFVLDPLGSGLVNKLRKMIYLWLIGVRNKVYGLKIAFDFNIKPLRDIYFRLGIIKNTIWGPLNAVHELKNISHEFNGYSTNIDMARVRDEIRSIGDESIVVIFPGGGFPCRLWPVENYVELIKRLKKKNNDVNFYLIGGKGDMHECEAIYNLSRGLVRQNLCGMLNLMEVAFLIKKAKLYIGNDSGITHLSSALGVTTIVIESAQNYPGFWWESREDQVYVIRLTTDCQYCHSYPVCPTGTLKCIRSIEVSAVEERVCKILMKN